MSTTLVRTGVTDKRADRLVRELRAALKELDRSQMAGWAADAARVTGHVFVRRGANLGRFVGKVAGHTVGEVRGAIDAARNGHLVDHGKARGRAAVDGAKIASIRIGARVREFSAMARDPARLPEAAVTVVAALVSSGGVDANGGIPDLDLQFGIGAHRSIFTHSIIAGSVVEGSLYAVATLVGLTHRYLPTPHDPLWDSIDRNRDRYLAAVTSGMSAGLAYHLLIDGTLQPGTYHDLPVHLPLEGHEAILVTNATAEAMDVPAKKDTFLRAGTPKR